MSQTITGTSSLNVTTETPCKLPVKARAGLSQSFSLEPANFAPLPPSDQTKVAFIFFIVVILLVGLVANIMVMVWICKGKKRKTSVDVYIISLGVADLLSVYTTLPLQIYLLINNYNWDQISTPNNAEKICKATAFFENLVHSVSFTTLVVIAIDRYIAVCHAIFHYTTYNKKKMKTVIIIICVWVVGISLTITPVVDYEITRSVGDMGDYAKFGYADPRDFLKEEVRFVLDMEYYNKNHSFLIPAAHPDACAEIYEYKRCVNDERGKETRAKTVFFIIFSWCYVIPLFILTYCYVRIIYQLWIRRAVGDLNISQTPNATQQRTKMKNTITMIVLISTFGVLWAPHWALTVPKYIQPAILPDEVVTFSVWREISSIISSLSIASSPVIYMFMDRNFRTYQKDKFIEYHRRITEKFICFSNQVDIETTPQTEQAPINTVPKAQNQLANGSGRSHHSSSEHEGQHRKLTLRQFFNDLTSM